MGTITVKRPPLYHAGSGKDAQPGRALALTRGRDYVVPPDVIELAPDVLRHRLVLSYEALADRVTADAVIERVLAVVPRPTRPFEDDPRLQSASMRGGAA